MQPLYHAIGSIARKKYTISNRRKAQNRADVSSLFARSGNFPTARGNFVTTARKRPWPLPLRLGATNAFGSANRAGGSQAQQSLALMLPALRAACNWEKCRKRSRGFTWKFKMNCSSH